MRLSRRKFSKDFKIQAVRRLEGGAKLLETARALGVHQTVLARWRDELREEGVEQAFPGVGKKKAEETRVAELERKIGQQAVEIDFLKKLLQRVEEARMLQELGGSSTEGSSKKPKRDRP
jgi:transposase-like protein